MEFTILPRPDVPNANGILFSHEAVDKAMAEYIATKVNQGNAPVLSRVPSLDDWDKIDPKDVIGNVTDIKFDEQSNSYKATMEFNKDADVYKIMEYAVLGTNKIGTFENATCSMRIADDSLKILSCTYMRDPQYNPPFQLDAKNENRAES